MSTEAIQVDNSRVVVALGHFRLGIQHNDELMRILGASMLVSVRRTFREQGSPAGSWAPLAASTIARDPKKYGAGHKLLIDKGTLLNSITFAPFTGGVTIGTNLIYARVQQEGSADRRGAAIGPQAKIEGRRATGSSYKRLRAIHYTTREVEGSGGAKHNVPTPMKKGKHGIIDKNGEHRNVSARYQGPLNRDIAVAGHQRYQNIPPRPFLVLRPEDPTRLRSLTRAYIGRVRAAAGLQGKS